MDYYFKVKKPDEFRYAIMSGLKECLMLKTNEEKLDLINQAKKDLFSEMSQLAKEIHELNNKLSELLTDEELKKEIEQEIKEKKEQEKRLEKEINKEKISPKKVQKNESQVDKNSYEVIREVTKKEPVKIESFKTEPVKKEQFKMPTYAKDNDELTSFNYTLDQIEKKITELKKD